MGLGFSRTQGAKTAASAPAAEVPSTLMMPPRHHSRSPDVAGTLRSTGVRVGMVFLQSNALAVCPLRRWVAVSATCKISVYCVDSGRFVTVLGRGGGRGDGQLGFTFSGMCFTPTGMLLVADCDRVVEFDPAGAGYSFLRVLGKAFLSNPRAVDCNADLIAVAMESLDHFVALLTMADGSLLARLHGGSQLSGGILSHIRPISIKLLSDGSGVVVANPALRHVALLGFDGSCLLLGDGLLSGAPVGVVECDAGVAFLVTELNGRWLTKLSRSSGCVLDRYNCVEDPILAPMAVALLPDGVVVAQTFGNKCVRMFTSLAVRLSWVAIALSWQRSRYRVGVG